MKIGILTFHCAHNYGAVLQAYALQEKLKNMGHEVEIIDYRPDYLVDTYKAFSLKNIFTYNAIIAFKKIVSDILTYYKKRKRIKLFNYFIANKLNLTTRIKNKMPDFYDLYIMGSDQIWNFKLTKGFDNYFYGNFKTKKTAKKITYAASFGDAFIGKKEIEYLKIALRNFNGISLRENESVSKINLLTNTKIETVLDPTLIIDKIIWEKIAQKPTINKKYVLVYQVIQNELIIKIANQIANQIGCIVIEIPAWVTIKYLKNQYTTTSPEQFLGWIKHADCIVTSSFHGTVFSIIFNRPFYTINLKDGLELRSKNLLESIGLGHRLIDKKKSVTFSKVNFDIANQKLFALKKDSLNYLENFLN